MHDIICLDNIFSEVLMKKLYVIGTVLVLLLIMTFAPSAYAVSPKCSITTDSEVKQGKNFSVFLSLEGCTALCAADIELQYDGNSLRLSNAELVDKEPNDVFRYNDTDGNVKIIFVSFNDTGKTRKIKLHFSNTDKEKEKYRFEVTKCSITNDGEILISPESLPVLDITAAKPSANSGGEAGSALTSKQGESSRNSSGKSGSSGEGSAESSKNNEKSREKDHNSDNEDGETASDQETSPEQQTKTPDTYYIQEKNNDASVSERTFIAAAGIAVIIILAAVIFFRIGRTFPEKKDNDKE